MQNDKTQPYGQESSPRTRGFASNIPRPALVAAFAFAVMLVVLYMNYGLGREQLKKDLKGTWCAYDDPIVKVLEIDEDTISYRLETGYTALNRTLETWDWRPTSANTLECNLVNDVWTKYELEFIDNKSGFSISPALSGGESPEIWTRLSSI